MSTYIVKKVDYCSAEQVATLMDLLQMYAIDPMGGAEAIENEVLEKLPQKLKSKPFMHSFIVYDEDEALGFANCIESFSTFSASSILNVHDFAVNTQHRGKGIGLMLMAGIESFAREHGYKKLTLEVLSGNTPAIKAYKKAGFSPYQLNPELGDAQFWQKSLS
ncbi:GNAT family N-acetyltransferase [Glaciecola petra]|uniref:GNAT family N-acetyltransferase n=1 Tax=Glaciecola petra TaxID=3075602 RepID=A0ABU2ZLW0_9ALTE|nr:GNAT family N-acetyltransferase [Aestuariibacter sp. P117]MDT0593390.1 GNAT family N-acetyltransferase [Aestuariibacter sp. P117]